MDSNHFVINATATKYGGALTILKEFLSEINKSDKKSIYYVFCGIVLNEFLSANVKIIKIKTRGFGIGGIKRFLWDSIGLYLYCRENSIKPDLIVSFQNTGVFFPNVKQLIYYHQSIPLYNYKWKFYRKDEAELFFYKEIYPFFVRLFLNRNTEFVVQQEFLKKLFINKFHISGNRVHVIVPEINLNLESTIEKLALDQNKFHIFYPTNHEKYKNYDILFEAMSEIKKISSLIFENIILHITLDKDDKNIINRLSESGISNSVNLTGNMPYKTVISYYNSVNLLVFPSYIETLGLPLIEAAYFGLPVLVADLDYAHEALKNYKGVSFVKCDDYEKWATAIIELSKTKQKFESFEIKSLDNSWSKFLELSNAIIKHNVLK